MALLVPMYNALKAVVSAAWPEVTGTGIYRAEQLDNIPWASLTAPYACVIASNFPKSNQYTGASQIAYAGAVQFLYLGKWGAAGQDEALLGRLDALHDYLLANALAFGQIASYDGMDWGDEIPGNSVVTSKDYNSRIARLQCTVLIGYA